MAGKTRSGGQEHLACNAAILLKVAHTMARLGIAPFPRNYELFYEALSGHNTALTRDLAALGAHPSQAQIEQIGNAHQLPGFAAIAADEIRADTGRALASLVHTLNDSIGKREAFAALLHGFITRLESDPVARMSDFAEEAGRLKNALATFEREEKTLAHSMQEAATRLRGAQSDVEALREVTTRDPVTGLANRIAFSAKLAALYDQGVATDPLSLAVVTVEGLRTVGENHGPGVAETALKRLAPVFRKSIKKNDFVARIGLDEFAFIFHDVTAENAEAIVQRVRTAVAAVPIRLPNRAFTSQTLALSAGIAMAVTADGGTDLFNQAELALRAVRAAGKPATMVFSAAIGASALKSYSPHAA